MKYIDEYRNKLLLQDLTKILLKKAALINKNITLMEVCGTHTYVIGRFGLKKLLPKNINIISGPGCPICVTSANDINKALYIANQPNIIFTTFGDMLKVPNMYGLTLQKLHSQGSDIRIITSPLQATNLALNNPNKKIILMGIGFETTSPIIASTVLDWYKQNIKNIFLLSLHKYIPSILDYLIKNKNLKIDGFICPGHVSTIIGIEPYKNITNIQKPAVIIGFEPSDILEGIIMILNQIIKNRFQVEIQYSRAVNHKGNKLAQNIMNLVFEPYDADWRGLGKIAKSGLVLKKEFADFDVNKIFKIPVSIEVKTNQCKCGEILSGIQKPIDCPLFKNLCTPSNPIGPCMVSNEGSCAIYFKYEN